MKIIITVLSFFSFFHAGYCQPKPVVSEIGEWKLEDDLKSRWEFKNDGKLYASYVGREPMFTYTYEISDSKPFCPGMEIGEKPNITYLKIVDENDGDIGCFYIFGLNDKRLTLIDASTGQIAPFIRVE